MTDQLPESKHFYYSPDDTRSVRKPLPLFTADQMRAYAQEAARQERELCAKVCEALRDAHCAGTKLSPDKGDWCEHDDQCCEFVVGWNDAAAAIRARSAEGEKT